MKWVLSLMEVVPILALVTGCGDDDDDDEGDDTAAGTEVSVTLREFEVIAEGDSAAAGEVTFVATNEGPDDDHELVIVKTDLEPDALPTSDDGSFDESGDDVAVINEIEGFAPDTSEQITVDLEAGAYVLLCNLVEEEGGETEAHYDLGMRTEFTVD
jgi:uncharacterized cupredoxin-like copper-binding protein